MANRPWTPGICLNIPLMTVSKAKHTDLLSVLSNEIRLEVLTHLTGAAKRVGDIARELELAQSTVSHALSKLSKIGLVDHETIHKEHVYCVTSAVRANHKDRDVIEIATDAVTILLRVNVQ